MPNTPDTRQSLMIRLSASDNEAAWDEFVSIYRPVIVRVAIARGLQPSDADDLAQQVLMSVAKHIKTWESNPQRARFRTWLGHVIRNAAVNALSRRAADRGLGGTESMRMFNQQANRAGDSEALELQWRREAFRWAADQIRDEFKNETWEAFWLLAVESLSPVEVAKRVNKSVGAVYVAKSRVMQRLQQKVRQLEGELPQEVESVDQAK